MKIADNSIIFIACIGMLLILLTSCNDNGELSNQTGLPDTGNDEMIYNKSDDIPADDNIADEGEVIIMLKAVNHAAASDDMRKALESPELNLNLDAYFRLNDSKDDLSRTRAVLSVIYEKPLSGYSDKKILQNQLDSIVARLDGSADMPVPYASETKIQDPDFFPLGAWLQAPENAQAYQKIGINTFVGLWNGLNSEAIDLFRKTDMKVICEMNEFAVEYIKDNPDDHTVTGWMQWDEPDNAQNTGSSWGPPVDPGSVIVKYNQIKKADPFRPVFLGLGQGVAHRYIGRGIDTGKDDLYDLYIKGADIICFDIYPANAEESDLHNKFWLVPKGVDNLRARGSDEKPVWAWIETGSINGVNRPSPEQIRAEVWMAIIHGAKGIGYFMHEFSPVFHEAGLLTDPENSANKEMVSSVNQLITALAPVINSPGVNCASVKTDHIEIPVDMMIKEYNGDTYIFAAAMRDGETAAVFTLTSQTGKNVTVIGEDRTLEITNGQFTDTFKSFDIHIYRF
ncbi:MAG: hypothetical protein ACYCWE_01730 [Eubacteriales bacterium]